MTIDTLKLNLFKHQFPDLFWHKKEMLEKMTFFTLFAYMESWFTSSLPFSGAQNDFLLHQRLFKFSKFHKKISNLACQFSSATPGSSQKS